ncbi:MAG: hypothetical protein DWQ09_17705 [Proteobacteria bacterium]|nr:MAG: hypothetical protein DWQ09_17705 [Pseudomonadota bacterium]QKK11990.1 MAG: hypothetical protein HND59_10735 [Pseudomonadota bacterium]
MDDRIRQRLVGATVLVALGVIFLPMLFDTPNRGWLGEDRPLIPAPLQELQNLAESARMAAPPVVTEPEQSDRSSSTNQPERSEVRDPPARVADLPAPSRSPRALSPDPQLATWAVQVGSFSSEENATRLRDKLRKLGFRAYTEEHEEDGKQATRVRVGPELDEERAKKLLEKLKAKARIEGIVVRHR